MDIEIAKKQLQKLIDIVNSLSPENHVEFNQQDITKRNMSIVGGNGRLTIQPTLKGYDIGLSGKSIQKDMYEFMRDLCKSECTGYKQTNKTIGKQDLPFWRVDDFNLVCKAVYKYAGANIRFGNYNTIAEEVYLPEKYFEGATKTISVNMYERNSKARNKCIEHYGCSCTVCDFNFGEEYGVLGENFIHIHHLKQLSEVGQEYQLDPINDLRPVCPNCHSMLHRRTPALSIYELKQLKNS